MENLNLLFNKLFYENMIAGQKVSDLAKKVKRLTDAEFYGIEYEKSPVAKQTFMLKTVYPGLLAGVGYVHGISDENDVKVGFSFDYVTGQPYLPGSSVKGVLRDVFTGEGGAGIVAEILASDALNGPLPEGCDIGKAVKDIENSIFEGDDVFLDAVLVRGNSGGRVMADDSITHHPSPTKNPTPIKIFKVLPDVIFEFRFKLKDTVITLDSGEEYKLSAGRKNHLFREMIKTFGIGAKTNTGYGNFVDAERGTYTYPNVKTELAADTGSDRPRQQQGGRNPQTNNDNRSRIRGKECPSCGAYNFRCRKDSDEEWPSWKRGVCRSCGAKLFD